MYVLYPCGSVTKLNVAYILSTVSKM